MTDTARTDRTPSPAITVTPEAREELLAIIARAGPARLIRVHAGFG